MGISLNQHPPRGVDEAGRPSVCVGVQLRSSGEPGQPALAQGYGVCLSNGGIPTFSCLLAAVTRSSVFKNQGADSLGVSDGELQGEESPDRMAPDNSAPDIEVIEERDHVTHDQFRRVRGWIVRRITRAMSPEIPRHHVVIGNEGTGGFREHRRSG